MERFDVVVIGGGAAGTAAALSARRAGARTALIRRGPGATALTAGAWRDAPPAPFGAALADAGHPLLQCDGALPHPDGTLVECAAAAASHVTSALATSATDILVCGIAGLPHFHAAALARLWSDTAGLPEGAMRATTLTLDGTPAAGWSPVSLAGLLERDPDLLGRALARAISGSRPHRVIVPAVLGLDSARVMGAVTDAAGVPVGEALGSLPSVPGWRLDRALLRATEQAGVPTIAGRVTGADVQGRAVNSIRIGPRSTSDAGAAIELTAGCFVLATGKFLGGGITADVEFEEPALGCDVALERFARTIDDPGAALVLTDPDRAEPQPVLSAGVRVDAGGHPLDPWGDAYALNVFVAGSVRAGHETSHLGLGAAAAEGWSAGERAAAHAASTES